MNAYTFNHNSIVNLGKLGVDELRSLASYCEARANDIEWATHCTAAAERDAKWKREREEAEAEEKALVAKLQKVIKPGTRLKMKGCKDGHGLREFIEWEGNNLVCWQISRSVVGGCLNVTRNKIVTTHMPDKVQEIYVDGTALKVKSICA
jgi:hypothetical protein